jgi:hypothetical protein
MVLGRTRRVTTATTVGVIILLISACISGPVPRDFNPWKEIVVGKSTKEDVKRIISITPTTILNRSCYDYWTEIWQYRYAFHGIFGSTINLIPNLTGSGYPGYNKYISTDIYFDKTGIVTNVICGDFDDYQKPCFWIYTK